MSLLYCYHKVNILLLQDEYIATMLLTLLFQFLLLCSRSMILHHVMHHISLHCLKIFKKNRKRKIKSRKIDKLKCQSSSVL